MSSLNFFEFPSHRPVMAGLHGAVASAHPLASQVGLDVLRAGGNAIDAAIATAAALGVVEPYMSGPGGVGFLLLHLADGNSRVLNFSGNTPAAGKPDQFTPQTQERGSRSCLIPGNVAGWFEALSRHGTWPAEKVFAGAIRLARDGFPLHPFNVRQMTAALERLNEAGLAIHGRSGPPTLGAVLRQPELATTYDTLVRRGPEEFYRGRIAEQIVEHVQQTGGILTREDLAGYQPEWQDPIAVPYREFTVRTCPPNCEGFQILQTLLMLERMDLHPLGHNSADYIHLLSEAVKLAVADRIRWAGDPHFNPVPLDRLLAADYIDQRRALMNPDRASLSEGERWRSTKVPNALPPGGEGLTTHLAVVDREGNVASITQSLGATFGSGVVIPGTGVALNNFIFWCEIDPACPTPNLLAPGKRWACCMAPVHVLRGNQFWFSISTPGSYGILHTTVQMLLNIVEFGADMQQAIEAPRFRLYEDTRMQIEDRVPLVIRDELTRLGHSLELVGDFNYAVGGGQGVMIHPHSGARMAGADPRRDGYALAY